MYILHEKSDIHDTYALMTSRMWQPFALTQQIWTHLTTPEKKVPDTIPSRPANQSAYLPPSFSPLTAIEAVIKARHLLMNKLYQSTGSITPACDQYIQYLLTGANPSLSPSFPTDDPPLSPKGPVRSQVNHPIILQLNQGVNTP
jgi:hypothetical protein